MLGIKQMFEREKHKAALAPAEGRQFARSGALESVTILLTLNDDHDGH